MKSITHALPRPNLTLEGVLNSIEPVIEPVIEPAVKLVTEPRKEPVIDPAIEPGTEPAIEPGIEPVPVIIFEVHLGLTSERCNPCHA